MTRRITQSTEKFREPILRGFKFKCDAEKRENDVMLEEKKIDLDKVISALLYRLLPMKIILNIIYTVA